MHMPVRMTPLPLLTCHQDSWLTDVNDNHTNIIIIIDRLVSMTCVMVCHCNLSCASCHLTSALTPSCFTSFVFQVRLYICMSVNQEWTTNTAVILRYTIIVINVLVVIIVVNVVLTNFCKWPKRYAWLYVFTFLRKNKQRCRVHDKQRVQVRKKYNSALAVTCSDVTATEIHSDEATEAFSWSIVQ